MSAWLISLDALAPQTTSALWSACWQGGVLIAIIAVLCRVASRMPAAARCALWWLACLRLCVGLVWCAPIRIPLLPARPQPAQDTIRYTAMMEQQQKWLIARNAAPEKISIPSHGDMPSNTVGPLIRVGLLAVWLIGILLNSSLSLVSLRSIRRLIRAAVVSNDPALLQVADSIAARLGMRRTPLLLVSEAATEPLAISGRRNSVLISRTDLQRLSEQELRAVLAHEFAHIRRADLWLGLVPLASQTLFWFYPAAWLAGHEFAIARETACDLVALQATQIPSRAYSGLLLKLGASHIAFGSSIVPGVTSDFRHLKRRIVLLHQSPLCSRRAFPIGLVPLFAAVICLGLLPWQIVAAQTPSSESVFPPLPKQSADFEQPVVLEGQEQNPFEQRWKRSADSMPAAVPLIGQGEGAPDIRKSVYTSEPDYEIGKIDAENAEIGQLLVLVFNQVHADFLCALPEPHARVTLHLRHISLKQALYQILACPAGKNLHCEKRKGIFLVAPSDTFTPNFAFAPNFTSFSKQMRVFLHWNHVGIFQGMAVFLHYITTNWDIAPGATDATITASATNVSGDEALQQVLAGVCKPMKLVIDNPGKDNETYHLTPK